MESEHHCAKCGNGIKSYKEMKVAKLPQVLCIQFKVRRGSNDLFYSLKIQRFATQQAGFTKVDTKIKFPGLLDIRSYMSPQANQLKASRQEYYYDLHSVIEHRGQINNGHYINYAKTSGQWFKFDDGMVSIANETEALSSPA